MRSSLMNQAANTRARFIGIVIIPMMLALPIVSGCSSGEGSLSDTSGGLEVRSLSPRADMVSGGDVLVAVALPEGLMASEVSVSAGGRDVSQEFRVAPDGESLVGLVTGLPEGASTIQASAGGQSAALDVVNFPLQGPIFSGPHQEPFVCETETYGLPGTPDENCVVPTQVSYLYRTSEGNFQPYDPDAPAPEDLTQTTTVDGETVDFIVRQEAGVINRAIYEIVFLHQPDEPLPDMWTDTPGWNGRLVYTFGGGCAPAYKQGRSTGGTLRGFAADIALAGGYAVASSSLNVLGNNCNDVTSAEATLMVKEHFIENYGVPEYTVGYGGSGGAMQQHLIANNYPGLLDGILPRRSYPDTFSLAPAGMDCALLERATRGGRVAWSDKARSAVAGFAGWSNCIIPVAPGEQPEFYTWINSGFSHGWMTPEPHPPEIRPDCNLQVLGDLVYDTKDNPDGADCSIYGNAVNVIGVNPETGMAYRLYDNLGVQYGLVAFDNGEISAEQFVELNERVGGFDAIGHLSPERADAPVEAVKNAHAFGRINNAGGGLAEIPIIDFRTYLEQLPDIHDRVRSFAMRARLEAANGHADNQVMIVHHRNHPGGAGDVDAKMLGWMDQWLAAIEADNEQGSRAERVVRNKPAGLSDGCYSEAGDWVAEPASRTEGQCTAMYPSHGDPRLAAAQPISEDILKCQLQPLQMNGYEQQLTDNQFARLQTVFPDGVCDYSQPGSMQQEGVGDWQAWRNYSR